jgi:hypothetical protein
MKTSLLLLFLCIGSIVSAQKIDSVAIPRGVVYKYTDAATIEKAKQLIEREISGNPTYELDKGVAFIGPVIWSRYKKVTTLAEIKGGDVTINYNKEKLSAKMTQNHDDFKKIWDQVRAEVKDKPLKIRKATFKELQYYWSVISFDIEEPLFIAEIPDHRFIINLSPKDLSIVWLDEVHANF